MKEKILLNSKKSKSSANVENNLTLHVESNSRALPIESIESKLNEYKQYVKEKEKSNKYRLSFFINPICSNVLFNNISEIIYKEGSDDCFVFGESNNINQGHTNAILEDDNIKSYLEYKKGILTHSPLTNINQDEEEKETVSVITGLTRYDLIRDTSFSHSELGEITYHCGYDMFNNHILREKEYAVVNKLADDNTDRSGFNTIDDYMRDYNGNNVEEYMNNFINKNPKRGDKIIFSTKDIHLYLNDTLYNFEESINENLTEKDGWYGFINKTNLDLENFVYNGKKLKLNKCLNNNKSCEFIDMYPDRSLFSFIPKVNKYRSNRLEKNWDYCLTYPKSNFYDNPIVENTTLGVNGLECEISDVDKLFDEENYYLTLKTKVKNNLDINSIIDIVIIINNTTALRLPRYEKIVMVGYNNKDTKYYCTIYKEQVLDYLAKNNISADNINNIEIRMRKVVDGSICKYYIRKFGKIGEFNSIISKTAFSENIYSDRIAQILFNDDVDLSSLKDNLGRKVSEIFLTIIKRNQGHTQWEEGKFNSNEIEYSHCFGEISSGFNMGFDANGQYYNDYNVHRLNNLPKSANYWQFNKAYKFFPEIKIDFNNIKTEEELNALLKEENIDKIVKLTREINGFNIGIYSISKTERGTFALFSINSKYNKAITSPISLEEHINVQNKEFNGDIVEFSPNTLTETVLEDVLHRFNTLQREGKTKGDADIWKDVILSDDYDVEGNNFKVVREKYNAIYATENKKIVKIDEFIANIAPEGYFYKPHYRILLKLYNSKIYSGQHTRIIANNIEVEEGEYNEIAKYFVRIRTNTNYYPELGREIWVYDKFTNEKIIGKIIEIKDKKYFKDFVIIIDKTYALKDNMIDNYNFFKPNIEKPEGAYELEDGTGTYLWQEFISEAESNNTELSGYTFTNGAHYINKQINFFLRRQDPTGKFDLNNMATDNALISNLAIGGNDVDYDTVEYNDIDENNNLIC